MAQPVTDRIVIRIVEAEKAPKGKKKSEPKSGDDNMRGAMGRPRRRGGCRLSFY